MSEYPYLDSLRKQFDEKDLKDRFFLEELWKSLNEEYGVPLSENGNKSNTFLSDWLRELVEKTPMTQEEREEYIKEQFDLDWFPTWEELIEAGVLPEESKK